MCRYISRLLGRLVAGTVPEIMEEKVAILRIERDSYSAQTTLGRLYFIVDGEKHYFCETLEDTVRPDNIKVYEHTAIPGGVRCQVSPYTRPSGQETIIFNTGDEMSIKHGILSWTYVLAHGGNTHKDTAACLLVAKNRVNKDTIQGAMTAELRAACDRLWADGYKIEAEWVNLPQIS